MSMYSDDIRNSQARTSASYATAPPQPDFLPPPNPSFLSIGQSLPSTPRESGGYDSAYEREPLATPTNNSVTALSGAPKETSEGSPFIAAPAAGDSYDYGRKRPFFKRPIVLFGLAALVAVVVVAVVVPVVLTTRHNSNNNASAHGGTSSGGSSGDNGSGSGNGNGTSNGDAVSYTHL